MAMVNRIKCTAVDCDLFQRPTLNVQRSTFNQYPVVLSDPKHLCHEVAGVARMMALNTAHWTLKAERLRAVRLLKMG